MTKEVDSVEKAKAFSQQFTALKNEIQKVIVGQEEIIELLLVSLFSKGHCLLVGVYGWLPPMAGCLLWLAAYYGWLPPMAGCLLWLAAF